MIESRFSEFIPKRTPALNIIYKIISITKYKLQSLDYYETKLNVYDSLGFKIVVILEFVKK